MMKKVYEKPQIMFESFELSTNVAAGCGIITNLPSAYACGYQPDRSSYIVFVTAAQGCTYVEDDGDHNGICYHEPGDDSNLFNS